MTKITARYEGPGAFEDHDKATDPKSVRSGGTFTTSKKRLGELQAQGIDVVEVASNATDSKAGDAS